MANNKILESLRDYVSIEQKDDGTTMRSYKRLKSKDFSSALGWNMYQNCLQVAQVAIGVSRSSVHTEEERKQAVNEALRYINMAVDIISDEIGYELPNFKRYNLRAWIDAGSSFRAKFDSENDEDLLEKSWTCLKFRLEKELWKVITGRELLDARAKSNYKNQEAFAKSRKRIDAAAAKIEAQPEVKPEVKPEEKPEVTAA